VVQWALKLNKAQLAGSRDYPLPFWRQMIEHQMILLSLRFDLYALDVNLYASSLLLSSRVGAEGRSPLAFEEGACA
jgi:hypothetical protein